MGLASKVQNAGGASALTASAPAASASGQSAGYPQITSGQTSGIPQRPQLPAPSPSGGQVMLGSQFTGARPSLTPQLSLPQQQQQQQQRPALQHSASFQPSPTYQGYPGQPGMPGQGQPGSQPQRYGQPGMPQGYPQSGLPQGYSQQGMPQGMPQGYSQPGMPQGMNSTPSYQPNNYSNGPSQNAYPQLMAPPQQPRPSAPPQQQYQRQGNVQPGLQQKLESMIRTNRLEQFYPAPKLQQVLQRLSNIDFTQLAQRWNMPLELAYDLSTLALYDIVIYADDSGSMIFEEGGERIQDLKLILAKVAEVATLFDDDGIVVRFMNSQTQGNGIHTAQEANNLISQVNFTGMTPLGSRLEERVIRPFLAAGVQGRNLEKPILVITITDGEPVGEPQNTVSNVIKNAKTMVSNSVYGPGAIAFEFAQVGKDTKAQAFLGRLDNDPDIGGMIDATSYFELEAEEYMRRGVNLTPELWLVKLMVGAVDPTYDEQDA